MPVYEYICDGCGRRFEVSQSITDSPITACPECKGTPKRIISGGSGFIVRAGSGDGRIKTRCGKAQTCCGSSEPCGTPSCDASR